ncbi:PKD domain-containing protein [Spirochaetota bacterium]
MDHTIISKGIYSPIFSSSFLTKLFRYILIILVFFAILFPWQDCYLSVPPPFIGTNYNEIEFTEEELADIEPTGLPAGWDEIDLSGTWKLYKVPGTDSNPQNDVDPGLGASGYYHPAFNDSAWPDVTVPHNWHVIEGTWNTGTLFYGVGWYRRIVWISSAYQGKRVFIRFRAVDYQASVFINGIEAGKTHTGMQPFEYDITDLVNYSANNTIAVRVFEDPNLSDGSSWYTGEISYFKRAGIFDKCFITVRNDVYAENVRIRADMDGRIHAVFDMVNKSTNNTAISLRAQVKPLSYSVASIIHPGSEFNAPLGQVIDVPIGVSSHSITFSSSTPALWYPDHPWLYAFELSDNDTGKGIFKNRIGFREFKVIDTRFILNGKPVKIYGTSADVEAQFPGNNWGTDVVIHNKGKMLTKWLKALKKCNMNLLRIHHGRWPIGYYEEADKCGMMIEDTWGYHFGSENMDDMRQWLLRQHNFSSIVLWCNGNEYWFQWSAANRENIKRVFDMYHKMITETDIQERPYFPWSGTWWPIWPMNSECNELYQDVYSQHFYHQDHSGSYVHINENLDYRFNELYATGGGPRPFINSEVGGFWHNRSQQAQDELEAAFASDPVDFDTIYKWITISAGDAGVAPIHIEVLRKMLSSGGISAYYDLLLNDIIIGEHFKRHIDEYRRVDGTSGMLMYPKYHTFRLSDVRNGEVQMDSGTLGFPYYWERSSMPLDYVGIHETPLFLNYQRAYSPLYVLTEELNSKIITGRDYIFDLLVVNDSPYAINSCDIRITVRKGTDPLVLDKIQTENTILISEKRSTTYTWSVPPSLARGTYTLSLYLYTGGGDPVCENTYTLYIEQEDTAPIASSKAIALFDPENTTGPLLSAKGISYTKISDFNNIFDYNVCMIGKDALDNDILHTYGDGLHEWIEAGNTMLCFEYSTTNGISIPLKWTGSDYSVNHLADGGIWNFGYDDHGSFAQIVKPDHPIFQDIIQDEFDTWNTIYEPQNIDMPKEWGILYRGVISPLSKSVLVTGHSWLHYNIPEMTAMEEKIGSGTYIHSQLQTVARYGNDSVATKYLNNLLAYALSINTSPSPSTQRPVALLTDPSLRVGYAPFTIDLDASPSYDPDGSITSYEWFFSDGVKASGVNVSHTFTNASIVIRPSLSNVSVIGASLVVTDDKGAKDIIAVPIIISNKKPVPVFNISTPPSHLPCIATLDFSNSYDIDTPIWYLIDFGDKRTIERQDPVYFTRSPGNTTHEYFREGTFYPVLTVGDPATNAKVMKPLYIPRTLPDDRIFYEDWNRKYLCFEAEQYWFADSHGDTKNWQKESYFREYTGNGYMYLPVTWTGDSSTWSSSSELSYAIEIFHGGEYHIALRCSAPEGGYRSIQIGLDGVYRTEINDINDTDWDWTSPLSLGDIDPGVHTINIRRRTEGFALDRIMLAKDISSMPSSQADSGLRTTVLYNQYSGQRALRLTVRDAYNSVYQDISVEGGVTYDFSVMAKAENITGGNIYTRIDWYRGYEDIGSPVIHGNISGNTGYTEISFSAQALDDATTARIYLGATPGSGAAYFDNASVNKSGSVENLLLNPGFEFGNVFWYYLTHIGESGPEGTGTRADEVLLRNIHSESHKEYVCETLRAGKSCYYDIGWYRIKETGAYEGISFIRTDSADYNRDNLNCMDLEVYDDMIMYIAYDAKAVSLPDWLSTWIGTGDSITANNTMVFNIYAKPYKPGLITLGGNAAAGSSCVSNMYFVLGKKASDETFAEENGTCVIEAERLSAMDRSTDSTEWQFGNESQGYNGSGYMHMPKNGLFYPGWNTACSIDHNIHIKNAGNYYLSIRALAADSGSDEVQIGVNGFYMGSLSVDQYSSWNWSGGVSIGYLEAGYYKVNIKRGEDGLCIDRIMIADSTAKLPSIGSSEMGPVKSDLDKNTVPVAHASLNAVWGDQPLTVKVNPMRSFDYDGTIESFDWDFGEGTYKSGHTNVSNVYFIPGNYTVTLTVTDNEGAKDEKKIDIIVNDTNNAHPVASFDAFPVSGPAPLLVDLDAGDSYDPEGASLVYDWDLGDGESGSDASVQHTYTTPGRYRIVLTVYDNNGYYARKKAIISISSRVKNPSPVLTWIKIDDTHPSISYTSAWDLFNGNPGYQNTEHYCKTAAHEASYAFTGSQVRYYGFKRWNLGYAEIYLDGVLKKRIDCYHPAGQYDQLLYESAVLAYGEHTIMVKVKGEKNPASTGIEVIVDAFEYIAVDQNILTPTPTPTHTPTPTDTPTATFTPTPTATPTGGGDDERLTGSIFGYGDPYLPGSEFFRVFDRDLNTFFDSPTEGAYTGIDIGSMKQVTRIRFLPRIPNFANRMKDGRFQGSLSKTKGYVDLYVISSDPAAGWNEVTINDPNGYRYLRYVGSVGGFCNVTEIEFYGKDAATPTPTPTPAPTQTPTLTPTDPGVEKKLSGSIYGYGDAWAAGREYDKAFDGDTSTFFDCALASGGYTGIHLAEAAAVTKIRFYPRLVPNFAARMQNGKFQGSDDGSFYTDIYIIYDIPAAGWNEVTLPGSSYTHLRYIGPTDAYCNVAEIEFYGIGGAVDPTDTPTPDPTNTPTPVPTFTPTFTPTDDPGASKLTGTLFGYGTPFTAGSEYDKVFDGNTSSFFDTSTDGAYTGLDAGSLKQVIKIRFYPRLLNFAGRMVGGKFQGSTTSSSSGYTDLHTISATPQSDWNEVLIPDTSGYRYLRYIGPTGGYCNVAEIEFYGKSIIIATSTPTTPPSGTPVPITGVDEIVSGSTYVLQAKCSSKVCDVETHSTAEGANVIQYTYGGGENQQWILESTGDGYYVITAQHSGLCMDVAGASQVDGANVHQWTYISVANQEWSISETGDGYFVITARHSGKTLSVENSSSVNAANIIQMDYSGADGQKWNLLSFDTASAPTPTQSSPTPTSTPTVVPTATIVPSSTPAFTPTATPASSINLAPNPGFEQDPDIDYFTVGSAAFGWTDERKRSGSKALKIDSSQYELTRWLSRTTRITAESGHNYACEVYMNIENVNGSAYLEINFWDSSLSYIGGVQSSMLSGSKDWTRLSVQKTAPAGAAYVRIEFRLNGTGMIWIDDVLLQDNSGI